MWLELSEYEQEGVNVNSINNSNLLFVREVFVSSNLVGYWIIYCMTISEL